MNNQNERTKHNEREHIVSNVLHSVGRSVLVDEVDRTTIMLAAQLGARIALDYAGFSDDDPQDTPRPVSVPPRMPRKNGEYGPTELRRTE